MTEPQPYTSSARYWPSEVAVLLLNAVLEGEHGVVHDLLTDLADGECRTLLPVLLATAANGLSLLPTQELDLWRSSWRLALEGLPRAP